MVPPHRGVLISHLPEHENVVSTINVARPSFYLRQLTQRVEGFTATGVAPRSPNKLFVTEASERVNSHLLYDPVMLF